MIPGVLPVETAPYPMGPCLDCIAGGRDSMIQIKIRPIQVICSRVGQADCRDEEAQRATRSSPDTETTSQACSSRGGAGAERRRARPSPPVYESPFHGVGHHGLLASYSE